MRRGIVFDLDGTLYDAPGVDAENRDAALGAISDHLMVSMSEADALLVRTQGMNGVASISRALYMIGVPDAVFFEYQLKTVFPERHIMPDPVLVGLVRRAMRLYKIALYTNTRRELVPRIVKCLGFLEGEFDVVVAGGDAQEPKPSIIELKKVVQRLGVDPVECYAVGDRWAVDLAPASLIGMTPVHVKTRDDLIKWLESII